MGYHNEYTVYFKVNHLVVQVLTNHIGYYKRNKLSIVAIGYTVQTLN